MDHTADSDQVPGRPEAVAPGVVRVLAPNPSPMTFRGTQTYILGRKEVAVIDPGPLDRAHLGVLMAALAGRRVSHIFVTHAHRDHSPLASLLSARTGAPVFGFGPATAGRSALMADLAAQGRLGGGEGVDAAFSPDVALRDGSVVEGADWRIEALHTPGHMANHMCFAWNDLLFSGDHVMGWSTSLISPPDGDAAAFRMSCARLLARSEALYLPGHGPPIADGRSRVRQLLDHRAAREAQVLAMLAQGAQDVPSLTACLYADIAPHLHPAASRNILAHLIDLMEQNRVVATADLCRDSRFMLSPDF